MTGRNYANIIENCKKEEFVCVRQERNRLDRIDEFNLDKSDVRREVYERYLWKDVRQIAEKDPKELQRYFDISSEKSKEIISRSQKIADQDSVEYFVRLSFRQFEFYLWRDDASLNDDLRASMTDFGGYIFHNEYLVGVLGLSFKSAIDKKSWIKDLTKLDNFETKKEGINYIDREFPNMQNRLISQILDSSEQYVKTVRERGLESESIKRKTKNKYDEECVICGKDYDVVHHIVSLSDGGDDSLESAVTMCDYCHIYIGHDGSFQNSPFDSVEEFWDYIEDCKFSTEVTNSSNKPLLVSFLDKIENIFQIQLFYGGQS